MRAHLTVITALLIAGHMPSALRAETQAEWEATAIATAGSGDFAPLYNSAMSHGLISSAGNALIEGRVSKPLDLGRRLSWGAAIDLAGGYTSSVEYDRYSAGRGWDSHPMHPSSGRIQQLYAEVKYRGVLVTAGIKEHTSALLNGRLSSGDLIESGNARPIPEVRFGFVDFQDIPLTNGWVQIQGEAGYGKMTDGDWWESMYNRYNNHISTGEWYNYKRCYFRVAPRRSLTVTVGMQASAQWGGTTDWWERGEVTRTVRRKVKADDFLKMLIPTPSKKEDFYDGSHLGSWDLMASYRLRGGDCVKAYFSWPWEDGSGIGRRNGWDGLWGVEYSRRGDAWLRGAVVEYLDFTNQSGPLHFAPGDSFGSTISGEATGADDYYNNQYYNSYAAWGMSIGTPMIMAPIYNRDGYPNFLANRMRGFHIAAEGAIIPGTLDWRAAVSHRKAWGNGKLILRHPISDTSAMVEVTYRSPGVRTLAVTARLAMDRGSMPGNAVGALLRVSYSGNFTLSRSKSK